MTAPPPHTPDPVGAQQTGLDQTGLDQTGPDQTGPDLLGPALLGRSAMVTPGQPAPAALAAAERIVIDAAVITSPSAVTDLLHERWVTRTPVVIELAVDPDELRRPERSTAPVYDHAATFLFPGDRLRHLVWANTVDHRGEEPMWWHTVKATRACRGLTAGGPADVLLADGTPAWIDGGPRQPLDLDGAVLHRDDTERGRVAPQGRRVPATATEGLAPDQAEAVNASLGAVRVAAPAGSGKTRVLTARLHELLGDRRVPGDTVLALAYNTRAAAELRRRTPGRGAQAATVHSYALQILKRHLGDVTVLDERDVRGLLTRLVDPPRKANVDPLQPYLDSLEQVRIALTSPEQVDQARDDIDELPRVFHAFRQELTRRNAVDFPEMVYRAIELLLTDPAVREHEQARVGQVLVDEFQDLTPAYLLFIRLLASPQLQCFGVGDDDQVIYGHAGASPEYLLNFETLFPGAENHPLTVNYRCPSPVVAGAVSLLGHNAVRLPKEILPGPVASDRDVVVQRVHTTEQAQHAGDAVAKALADGADPEDIAVLARVRVALLGTQADLANRGIATRSPIGDWLLARTGVRAALAYLRLATDDEMSGEDLAEVLHRPLRAIPSTVKDRLRSRRWTPESLADLADGGMQGRSRRAMQDMARDLGALRARARRQPTTELLRFVSDVIGLGEVAASLDASSGDQAGSSHIDDLDALLQVADHCPEPVTFEPFLTSVVRQPPTDGPAVTLSTIHSVKGLEWPHVVVVGAVEGISPHRLATTTTAIEEERRVFHVAMTRASQQLTVVAPRTGTSRFVAEMLGEASMVGTSAAPRPTAGAMPRSAPTAPRPPKGRTRRSAAPTPAAPGAPRFRAAKGLEVKGSGGLAGTVESVSDDGALVRTSRGSLLRLRFGSEVRVDGTFGTLVRP